MLLCLIRNLSCSCLKHHFAERMADTSIFEDEYVLGARSEFMISAREQSETHYRFVVLPGNLEMIMHGMNLCWTKESLSGDLRRRVQLPVFTGRNQRGKTININIFWPVSDVSHDFVSRYYGVIIVRREFRSIQILKVGHALNCDDVRFVVESKDDQGILEVFASNAVPLYVSFESVKELQIILVSSKADKCGLKNSNYNCYTWF